jgi:hypothetical protein
MPSDIAEYPENVDGLVISAEPHANVVIRASTSSTHVGPSEEPAGNPDYGVLDVRVEAVLFKRDRATAPVEGTVIRLFTDSGLLKDVAGLGVEGSPILVGISLPTMQGSWFVDFGYDPATNEVLGQRSGESVVEEYILGTAADPDARTTLVVDWNIEREHAVGDGVVQRGPVMQGFKDLLETIWPPAPDIPPVGSQDYWDAAPPECRSLADAPQEVLRELEGLTLSIHVPDTVASADDATICVRSDLGGMGCSAMRPNPNSSVLVFDVYRDPGGGPIVIQLAHGDGSWLDRVTLVTIPDAELGDGVPTIELPDGIAGSTFDEIRASLSEAS